MFASIYLRQLQHTLPTGVELYLFDPYGIAHVVTKSGIQRLNPTGAAGDTSAFLRFIDDGQFARYLIGNASTSAACPSNATYKLGVMRPHSAFTPHAHGAEHFVASLGYASCGLYDWERERVVDVRLFPGTLLRIPSMLPHSFNNRARDPLLLLAANTGVGLDHADYAITATEAARRAAQTTPAQREPDLTPQPDYGSAAAHHDHPVDYVALSAALHCLKYAMPTTPVHTTLTWSERIAARLRKLAWLLERL